MEMNRIIEAKEKAERFLFWIVEQKWDDAIKNTSSMRYVDDLIEWPLRFEAHAYLGHRYKERIPEFAKELRALWLRWIDLKEKHKSKDEKLFWQLYDIFLLDTKAKEDAPAAKTGSAPKVVTPSSYPDADIELLVSMCRATETLGINEFDSHIDHAARLIFKWAMANDVFAYGNIRIIYHPARSPYLKGHYKEYIQSSLGPKVQKKIVKEEADYEERIKEWIESGEGDTLDRLADLEVGFWAEVGFFCSYVNLGYEKNDTIRKFALILIETQDEDGSFYADVKTTCLAACYINSCLPASSIKKEFISKAIEFILEIQNRDGSWSSCLPWDELDETKPMLSNPDLPTRDQGILLKTIADKAQTTVIVLETLDLICDLAPLPIWSTKEVPPGEKVSEDLKHAFSLPVPPGTEWNQVIVECLTEEYVYITVGDKKLGAQNYTVLGFRDEKTKGGNKLWELLLNFGKYNGTISYENIALKVSVKDVSRLRKELKRLFPIDGDPLPYSEADKAYIAKFKISYKEATEDPGPEKTEVEQLIDEEQADMFRKHRHGIESDYEKEIHGRDDDES